MEITQWQKCQSLTFWNATLYDSSQGKELIKQMFPLIASIVGDFWKLALIGFASLSFNHTQYQEIQFQIIMNYQAWI